MSSNKTAETSESVENFINAVDNEQKRKDSWEMIALMQEITGAEPRMWGSSLVGFGRHHYKYASGREVLEEVIRDSVAVMRKRYDCG